MIISFQNPGLIEPEAFTTFGVSAKENDNPIGFFGTGLKYAIAIILRLGGKVEIWRGKNYYGFFPVTKEFRGNPVTYVGMSHNGEAIIQLGYTTDVGKNVGAMASLSRTVFKHAG